MKTNKIHLLRRIFTLAVGVLLLASNASMAYAAEITVNDAAVGQTYSAYRIFDVTKTESAPVGYAYSIRSDSAWFADVSAYAATDGKGLALTATTDAAVYNVSIDDSVFSAADFAGYLNGKKAGKTADGTATAEDTQVTVSVGAAGYYFLDSGLGALCILHTAADTVTVNEKNAEPDVEKSVQEPTASIGDTLHYEIRVTAGGAADTAYIVHDLMEAGLTLNHDSFSLMCGGKAVPQDAYEITAPAADGHSFDIVFAEDYTAALEKDSVIVITYEAMLNAHAQIAEDTNDNTVFLTYGNSSSVERRTETRTFSFDLVKTTADGILLDGAVFRLYDAAEDGNEIPLVQAAEGVYRPAVSGETGTEIRVGKASIQGLANGTYYLEETAAPEGYNRLTARVAVNIDGKNLPAVLSDTGVYQSGGVAVENLTGSQLPSTGGVGTTMFYIGGGSLMLLASIVYFLRRRSLQNRG